MQSTGGRKVWAFHRTEKEGHTKKSFKGETWRTDRRQSACVGQTGRVGRTSAGV